MKKIFFMLAALLLFNATVLAAPVKPESPLILRGHISGINNHYITVVDNNNKNSVVILVGWDTLILSGESGKDVPLDRLNVGDDVMAYYSHIMTRSLPPQSHGYALVMTPKNKTGAMYAIVSDPQKTANGVRFLDESTNTYVTIPQNVSAELQNVQNGDCVLVWYATVALSNPAQAFAVKAEPLNID
ncbi:hypothetical protein [Pectinatus frisingensis]|jgi:hypothetical protein|uniref:hypothetical protein n=1 Tax=Pectinatus frisingensis TaxID=865 RepID=UPI0015F38900|nr:hypothetical protein [Pectinatus frisingensis]